MSTTEIFLLLSVPVVLLSYRNLLRPRTHGFWRFLSWEAIVWLFAANYSYWFRDPFSFVHLLSWILLLLSVLPLFAGLRKLRMAVKSNKVREEKELFGFERTSELIDTGIYRYIRHPLYSSLLLLSWGVCLKQASALSCVVAVFSSVCLYICARMDEKECVVVFGEAYILYRKRSKMFLPFIF